MEHKVDDRFREEIDLKLDDLKNRSKKNNLVFWNIPEGEEKDSWLYSSLRKHHDQSHEFKRSR